MPIVRPGNSVRPPPAYPALPEFALKNGRRCSRRAGSLQADGAREHDERGERGAGEQPAQGQLEGKPDSEGGDHPQRDGGHGHEQRTPRDHAQAGRRRGERHLPAGSAPRP